MKKIMQKLKNEDGVTLVELLAAVAILSIIVTSFLAFFIQAANTNNRIDDKNEATFIAIEEMELITAQSMDGSDIETVKTNHFNDENTVTNTKNGFNITTQLIEPNVEREEVLYTMIVTVKKGDTVHAQMETHLPFEKGTDDAGNETEG